MVEPLLWSNPCYGRTPVMLQAFRQGDFDQIEIIGQADEKEFLELCFQQEMVQALADSMPTARVKEEVPRGFILVGNLSLKLHLENAFHAFERVVRCGGLLAALPPEIATKHLDPQTQRIVLECHGFNDKNHYQRRTPIDQDTSRKYVRDVTMGVAGLPRDYGPAAALPIVGHRPAVLAIAHGERGGGPEESRRYSGGNDRARAS